jgi:hypothetical protein
MDGHSFCYVVILGCEGCSLYAGAEWDGQWACRHAGAGSRRMGTWAGVAGCVPWFSYVPCTFK